jgi:hypothetical protein
MKQFIAKFESQIQGTLSGFDRVLFRGSLRRLTHGEGITTVRLNILPLQ